MKIFTQGILARRKIVFLFFSAILLPSLVVGYLSFKTFSEKQKAVQNFLESSLWISGESALEKIEDELLDFEKSALGKELFVGIHGSQSPKKTFTEYIALSEVRGGYPFVLDKNFGIVFPLDEQTENEDSEWARDSTGSPFYRALQKAETLEFARRDYVGAIEEYYHCLSIASVKTQKAAVLEALGRCFLASENLEQAYKTYSELATDYDQFRNKAGHPYGLIAHLQLLEIEKNLDNQKKDPGSLIRLLEKLQNGEYPVSLPVYSFFRSEILKILEEELGKDNFLDLQDSFKNLKSEHSPYLKILLFADFLKRKAIPKMVERYTRNRLSGDALIDRFIAETDQSTCLVSYRVLPDLQDKNSFYGGFCWNLDALKRNIFPGLFIDLGKSANLHLRVVDDEGWNVLTGLEESISGEALTLSFRRFPLPWRLVVTQPALDDVARATRRDNVFYGLLLGFVVVLMLFGAFLIGRDISREAETTRLKTEFVHHVSHELKTPLTLIRLYGETLQRKKNLSRSERSEAYEIITKESERLSHLINNVLDFSRIEMGKKEFDFKKGNLAGTIRDTVESYRYHLEKKGFSVQEDIADNLPEMIYDAEGIASLLINLLSNAVKFSPSLKEVSVRLFQRENQVVLEVEDKGIGISSKERGRIFDRFYRSKDVKAADAKGSGLGLTLVKHTAEAHGGKVEVRSEPDHGSVFSILLPLSNLEKDK